MKSIRENPYFRVLAVLLLVCIGAFAFHGITHLEHAFEEDSHTCPLCVALAGFFLSILFLFGLVNPIGTQRLFVPFIVNRYANPTLKSLLGRAPPLTLS